MAASDVEFLAAGLLERAGVGVLETRWHRYWGWWRPAVGARFPVYLIETDGYPWAWFGLYHDADLVGAARHGHHWPAWVGLHRLALYERSDRYAEYAASWRAYLLADLGSRHPALAHVVSLIPEPLWTQVCRVDGIEWLDVWLADRLTRPGPANRPAGP